MYEERATIPLVLFLSIFVGRMGHCIGAGIFFSSTLCADKRVLLARTSPGTLRQMDVGGIAITFDEL